MIPAPRAIAIRVLTATLSAGCGGNPVSGPQAVQDFGAWAADYGCTNPAAGKGVSAATERVCERDYSISLRWDGTPAS